MATLLNAGVAVGRCNGLVLVASNPFLGRLKNRLSEQAGKHVQFTLSRDYTTLNDAELVDRMKAAAVQP